MYLAQDGYPAIRNALSGIIFLGTPHLGTADDERWENWLLLLKSYRRDTPKTALSRQAVEMLANVCHRFTSLTCNLPIQVLSVFETVETRVRDSGPLGAFKATPTTVSSSRGQCGKPKRDHQTDSKRNSW